MRSKKKKGHTLNREEWEARKRRKAELKAKPSESMTPSENGRPIDPAALYSSLRSAAKEEE